VLPHFKALKKAKIGLSLPNFVARDLTFILRVDGQINTFDGPSPGNLDAPRNREYVSLDLVVTVEDRRLLTSDAGANPIVQAIKATVPFLAGKTEVALSEEGLRALRETLDELCARYVAQLG